MSTLKEINPRRTKRKQNMNAKTNTQTDIPKQCNKHTGETEAEKETRIANAFGIKQETKATARPWRLKITANGQAIITDDASNQIAALSNQEIDHVDAALIVQAVNEYAALEAVAEAAKGVEISRLEGEENEWTKVSSPRLSELLQALANLAAVRKAGGM